MWNYIQFVGRATFFTQNRNKNNNGHCNQNNTQQIHEKSMNENFTLPVSVAFD